MKLALGTRCTWHRKRSGNVRTRARKVPCTVVGKRGMRVVIEWTEEQEGGGFVTHRTMVDPTNLRELGSRAS